MAAQDPLNTTVQDLCTIALRISGAVGQQQSPLQSQINDAWTWIEWLLQEWARKRWFVYHLQIMTFVTTGAQSYTVGPGGNFDTGVGSNRPDKIESAFIRQLQNTAPNQVDYPLTLLQSMEDYAKIPLKSLISFPDTIFYDPAWPLGNAYPYPVAQANIYALGLVVKAQLPTSFAALNVKFSLPFEYYQAITLNLAQRLRAHYNIPSFPGDMLPGLAKNSRNVLRGANTAIARLQVGNLGGADYNIFNDRFTR